MNKSFGGTLAQKHYFRESSVHLMWLLVVWNLEIAQWTSYIWVITSLGFVSNYEITSMFQGLAITFVSDETDAKTLNEVQDRFEVDISELPDEIDLSSYIEGR